MEYYGNRLCISARELVDGGVMTQSNYKQMANRGRFDVVRRGGGSSNNYALVAVDSLPESYREKVEELFPGGDKVRLAGWVRSNYEVDPMANAFFYSKEQVGFELPPEKIREYVTNASVLNCCIRLYERASTSQKLMGGKYNWDMMAAAIESLRDQFGHTLPASTLRFRKKVAEYKREGYSCLISGKFGNQSARKVDHKTERLILGIAILPNKPYNSSVWEMYNSFVCGDLEVYDPETGELFNPDDFTDKNGEPLVLSEATISNYLNKPKNRVLIEHALMSFTTFMHEQMPHVHRHAPEFSFSKISFDDRDLPRKLKDTKIRPKVYYAYDVTSQCVVGFSYNSVVPELIGASFAVTRFVISFVIPCIRIPSTDTVFIHTKCLKQECAIRSIIFSSIVSIRKSSLQLINIFYFHQHTNISSFTASIHCYCRIFDVSMARNQVIFIFFHTAICCIQCSVWLHIRLI